MKRLSIHFRYYYISILVPTHLSLFSSSTSPPSSIPHGSWSTAGSFMFLTHPKGPIQMSPTELTSLCGINGCLQTSTNMINGEILPEKLPNGDIQQELSMGATEWGRGRYCSAMSASALFQVQGRSPLPHSLQLDGTVPRKWK